MEVNFDEVTLKDLQYWQKSGNTVIQTKIQKLLLNIIESPYRGIGKPEMLKYDLAGSWSRRINNIELFIAYTKIPYRSIHFGDTINKIRFNHKCITVKKLL